MDRSCGGHGGCLPEIPLLKGMSRINESASPAGADAAHEDAIVIGFDAEWTNAARVDESLPASDNILLTWQMAVTSPASDQIVKIIFYAGDKTKRGRRSLSAMLGEALRQAMKDGVVAEPPGGSDWKIIVAGHFLRADMTTLRDFPRFKSKVDSVRKTFSTTSRPTILTVLGRKASITFTDTMLLAPNGTSLKKLGAVIGRPKIELPEGAIERMDLLLARDPELFKKYALEDAIIAALYYLKIRDVMRKDLGVLSHVATLGAASVKMIGSVLVTLGLSIDDYFGYTRQGRVRYWMTSLLEIVPFAANCYHGGRNEAYRIGLTPEGAALFDVDLKGAYTTALAMMRVPAWSSAAATTYVKRLAVVDEALTFARVHFKFPDDVRFPSLPVRAGARGLVYPLSGVSWCTGAELVVALGQGAQITVEAGWRCEWAADSPRPFEAFTRQIGDIRRRAKADGNALLDQTAKEIGNSCYGKIAQSVDALRSMNDGGVDWQRGKRVFDARSGKMKTLPGSHITNPMLAAFVTGIVRAMLSEALAGLPADAIVCTATTDGFLSSVAIERLPIEGPVASAFAEEKFRISPDDAAVWEEKHRVGRVIVSKMRGTFTVEPYDPHNPGKPILARAGYRLEKRYEDPWEECHEWVRQYKGRSYNTSSVRKSLTSLRKQWIEEADLVDESRDVRYSADFDFKRRPFKPYDCEGIICCDTRPWGTIEQFTHERDALEAWKKSKRRVLKTTGDLRDMREWATTAPGQKAVGSTAQSSRPPLVNAFMRGMARGVLISPVWPYEKIAALVTAAGFPCNVVAMKNAKHRGKLGEIRESTVEERAFAAHIIREHPDIEMEKLAVEGSPAAADLAARRPPRTPGARSCARCGQLFKAVRSSAQYCGETCRQAAHRSPL